MMPKMNGYQVARVLRQQHISTPILMLTAKSELLDRVQGLDSGADYYLTKPFDARELFACIHALLRRQGAEVDTLSFGNTTLNLATSTLLCEEKVGDLRDYNLRYYRSGARKWDGQIIIFMDISSEIATMQNLYRTCVIIGLGSFASFLVISIFFARWAVRPVEEAWAQQRQFVSDASHELKTPLTVILTDAEMLKSPRFDEAHKAQFVENILTMSNQMRGLVESLLQLARVDSGAIQKMPLQTIDLSGLVSDELLTFDALFFEKGLTLAEDITDGITIHGSPQHLKQVVEILLDNAQKYASPQGTVQVTLQKSGAHHCLLSVSDPGDPIRPEDLKKIFQRFYRIDEARAMNHSYGLGLSIAENIVKNHKGRIWAESAEGINTFRVELPMA